MDAVTNTLEADKGWSTADAPLPLDHSNGASESIHGDGDGRLYAPYSDETGMVVPVYRTTRH